MDRSQFAQESSKPQVQDDANVFFRHLIGFNLVKRNENLLVQPQSALDGLRLPLLMAMHVTFRAPDQVALYLFSPDGWVMENFNSEPVSVTLNGQSLNIPARGWLCHWN